MVELGDLDLKYKQVVKNFQSGLKSIDTLLRNCSGRPEFIRPTGKKFIDEATVPNQPVPSNDRQQNLKILRASNPQDPGVCFKCSHPFDRSNPAWVRDNCQHVICEKCYRNLPTQKNCPICRTAIGCFSKSPSLTQEAMSYQPQLLAGKYRIVGQMGHLSD